MMKMEVFSIWKLHIAKLVVFNNDDLLFVLLNAGQQMTRQRMFISDDEED